MVSLLAAVLEAGCLGTASPMHPASPPTAIPSLEEVDAAMEHLRRSEVLVAPPTSKERWGPRTETVRIREPTPTPARRSGRRVDVELYRASLAEALQLLADEARINLVLGDGIQGEVSLSLRRVDPAEALEVLVASRGLILSRQGSILVVQKR
ncbi:MAG: hypothetical protein RMJ98_10435 [Myxococcales bacterium]|nr:hypothetical protein [Polyangiaceae bacterium]MDW8249703.1 hypothetical protein [Myxococcales bacterium]